MKRLMIQLEVFFLAMTLVKDCEFKRGLQIRSRTAKSASNSAD